MPQRKAVAVVSDIHCGSLYGLLPPDFVTSDDRLVSQNPGQAYLWKCWQDWSEQAAKSNPSAIIANGDMIDGMQQAQKGTELCLPMLSDQSAAAAECLRYLLKACGNPPLFIVAGTEYHSQPAAREEEIIAAELGAVRYRGVGTGRYIREVLDLDVDGVVINAAHHIGVSGGIYRGTSIDREALFSALAGREGRANRCDVLVRSHCHYFLHEELPHRHAVITPCWQLQTRFMRKRSVYRMLPDIGGIILWIDGEAKKDGSDPVTIQKELYSLPKPPVTRL